MPVFPGPTHRRSSRGGESSSIGEYVRPRTKSKTSWVLVSRPVEISLRSPGSPPQSAGTDGMAEFCTSRGEVAEVEGAVGGHGLPMHECSCQRSQREKRLAPAFVLVPFQIRR